MAKDPVIFSKAQLDKAGKELASLVKAAGAAGLLKTTAIAELEKRGLWPSDFSGRGQVLKKAHVEKREDEAGVETYYTKEHAPKREPRKRKARKGDQVNGAGEQTMTFDNPDAASVTYNKQPRQFKGGIKRVIIILGGVLTTIAAIAVPFLLL